MRKACQLIALSLSVLCAAAYPCSPQSNESWRNVKIATGYGPQYETNRFLTKQFQIAVVANQKYNDYIAKDPDGASKLHVDMNLGESFSGALSAQLQTANFSFVNPPAGNESWSSSIYVLDIMILKEIDPDVVTIYLAIYPYRRDLDGYYMASTTAWDGYFTISRRLLLEDPSGIAQKIIGYIGHVDVKATEKW